MLTITYKSTCDVCGHTGELQTYHMNPIHSVAIPMPSDRGFQIVGYRHVCAQCFNLAITPLNDAAKAVWDQAEIRADAEDENHRSQECN